MSHVCEAHTENPKPNDLNELYREQIFFLSIFVGETPFMYIFIETYAFLVTKSNIFQQHGTQHPNYLQRQLLVTFKYVCNSIVCTPTMSEHTIMVDKWQHEIFIHWFELKWVFGNIDDIILKCVLESCCFSGSRGERNKWDFFVTFFHHLTER